MFILRQLGTLALAGVAIENRTQQISVMSGDPEAGPFVISP